MKKLDEQNYAIALLLNKILEQRIALPTTSFNCLFGAPDVKDMPDHRENS